MSEELEKAWCRITKDLSHKILPTSQDLEIVNNAIFNIRPAPSMDVEGLKKDRDFYDYKSWNWCETKGWNACINHLSEQGYLTSPDTQEGEGDMYYPDAKEQEVARKALLSSGKVIEPTPRNEEAWQPIETLDRGNHKLVWYWNECYEKPTQFHADSGAIERALTNDEGQGYWQYVNEPPEPPKALTQGGE